MSDIKKDNDRASVSEIDPVPLHRTYGVRKKEGFFVHLNLILARVIATSLFVLLAVAFAVALLSMLYMLRALGVVIAFTVVFCIVYFKLLRVVRKRASFVRRLKRECKKNGFDFEQKRGFFKGLRLNKSGYDLAVRTHKKEYYVRFFTCKKRNSYLIFDSEREITFRTNIIKNRIKAVYGLSEEINTRVEYTFDDPLPQSTVAAERVLVINPVPHTIYKKDSDGVICATGSGERLYGYTIYSGSDFISAIKREDRLHS